MTEFEQLYFANLTLEDAEHGGRPRVRDVSLWEQLCRYNTPDGIDLAANIDRIWVWSDQHYNHKNIIKYSNRPFDSISQMNDEMDRRYLQTISANDIIIWCGDVTFGHREEMNERLRSLPGYKIHIIGNHDIDRRGKLDELAFDETYVCKLIELPNGNKLQITHYPMTHKFNNTLNIHGHIHTYLANKWNLNVSVEHTNYQPTKLTTLLDANDFSYT